MAGPIPAGLATHRTACFFSSLWLTRLRALLGPSASGLRADAGRMSVALATRVLGCYLDAGLPAQRHRRPPHPIRDAPSSPDERDDQRVVKNTNKGYVVEREKVDPSPYED